MDTSRQLAAIMFTDIEGYTALMETDETIAMQVRSRHREVFESVHQKFNGRIIQYFGDGTLSTFPNSLDAIEAAIEMQIAFHEAPAVPLRIGIHSGEIVYRDQEIIGDSVNVASRIESLGVPGGILVSGKVYDDVKNKKEVQSLSMGFFDFKNSDRTREIFAITNRGIKVPDPEALVGKAKLRRAADRSVIVELWKRKVFHVTAAYLLGLWLLILGTNYFVENNAVSPYWSNIVLVFFISFLPSVIIYSYYHSRLEISNWRMAEKITIPSNTVLSILMIVVLFGNQQLGATTKTIVLIDEFGNRSEELVVKNEFRKGVIVYPFKNESEEKSLAWMSRGINTMLQEDLEQDNQISLGSSFLPHSLNRGYLFVPTIEAMSVDAQSKNKPMFVTGTFKYEDNIYAVISSLYEARTGNVLQQRQLSGPNLMDLCDAISLQLRKDMGIADFQLENSPDSAISTLFTKNMDALERYIVADFDGADLLDTTFALNNYQKASFYYRKGISFQEAKEAIAKAWRHRSRFSSLNEVRMRALYYNIYGHQSNTLAIKEMLVLKDPGNFEFLESLMNEYFVNGLDEKALTVSDQILSVYPESAEAKLSKIKFLLVLGRLEETLKLAQDYRVNYPNDIRGWENLALTHLDLGDYDKSEVYFKALQLRDPEHAGVPLMLNHVQYMRDRGGATGPELWKLTEGQYTEAFTEHTVSLEIKNSKLFVYSVGKGGSRLYPIDDLNFVTLSGIKYGLQEGGDNKYINEQSTDSGSVSYYKSDSTILKAYGFVNKGSDSEALEFFEKILQQQPKHIVAQAYIKHLRFKVSKEGQALLVDLSKYAGVFQDKEGRVITIFLEGGRLYYRAYLPESPRYPTKPRRELLAVEQHSFIGSSHENPLTFFANDQGGMIGLNCIIDGNRVELERTR